MNPFLRTAYNYNMNEAANEDAIHCTDESLTKQSFKDECDINVLMEQYTITGEIPQGLAVPEYRDFLDVYDYHTACTAIAKANEAFDTMPARVRARFHNNTEEFVVFCEDPANAAEVTKMGLTRLTQQEQDDERTRDNERTERTRRAREASERAIATERDTSQQHQTTPVGTTRPGSGQPDAAQR